MVQSDVRLLRPPPRGNAASVLRWVCTSNPFYVLSAGLFLAGLWISFGKQVQAGETWAFMSGLVGYTLLLAATACLLVRFGNVWDDVRTVLLLVVLMFLATSVTFDGPLVSNLSLGMACYCAGLFFAVLVSEGLLRGIRLELKAGFRLPYYLILGLFFLYPLALRLIIDQPHSEAMMWGLYGFAPAAGLIFLTLLPAIRRGPSYVRHNGSPWRWPLYPWTLFALLALAVPARAFLLCWSMHLLGFMNLSRLIFGFHFLVPFGLALAILLLEIGFHPYRRGVLWTALFVPVLLAFLVVVDHRPDPIYLGFVKTFTERLGGDPLFLTVLAAVAFYSYASLRHVPLATEALSATLIGLAFIGPRTLVSDGLVSPQPLPILAVAGLQMVLGLWRRNSWRFLLGTVGLVAAALLIFPDDTLLRVPFAFHLGLLAVLMVGGAFEDSLGKVLRLVGAGMLFSGCMVALFVPLELPESVEPWMIVAYPPAMALLLGGYGLLLRHRPSLVVSSAAFSCWLVVVGSQGYRTLRLLVLGLDFIASSLAVLGVAVLISLAKSGVLLHWIAARWGRVENSAE